MNVTIRGVNIHYIDEGAGEPLLFLHGWGCRIETFMPIIDGMRPFRRVIALDFPGFGQSDAPGWAYTIHDYADLTAEFMRALGLKNCDIVCHSFGGRVSILLAAKYPELTGRIVFTDAAGIRPRRTLKYRLKVGWFKLCKRAAGSAFGRKLFKLLGVDVEKKVKNAGSSDYRQLSGTMREIFVKVVNEDLTAYLSSIRSSSLLIYGENDLDTPVRFGKIMEKKIPDAGLVVLKNAGHYSYLDQYQRYMSIIKVFLGVHS